ncbi:hypothetical protein [Bradyrhizobium liaoningense]|uniref:hypothetical protein n=1 Tax=Bradyrhizobium liaoningense TaxID=43992 RepID=UPI0024E1937C|nr:hypothetical protein [Bradyrhizobium liaoningense]
MRAGAIIREPALVDEIESKTPFNTQASLVSRNEDGDYLATDSFDCDDDGSNTMKWITSVVLVTFALVGAGRAQAPDPDPALNTPDKVSWELFAMVNKSVPGVNNNVVFETWASNEDTFQLTPKFPGSAGPPNCAPAQVATLTTALPQQPAVTPVASPKILNVPALVALAPRQPGLQPRVVPGGTEEEPSEETRRNRTTFDFIACNKLQTKAGLRVAFASGQPISFPIESMEVKANWVPVGNRNPAEYHVNTASDNKRYALVSMHIISKQIPNWTWATFEHKDNIGRCDFIGCHDKFGAVVQDVAPHTSPGGKYDPCIKTPALKKLFADHGLPALWENYCLKGSQTDFLTATGLKTLLGNSVTEAGFADTSSCMTCHSRAAVDANGRGTTRAGFLSPPNLAVCPGGQERPCSPNGAPLPEWFWNNPGQPNQSLLALQTDFIWSIPRHAIGP